jgi:hypothetical protein
VIDANADGIPDAKAFSDKQVKSLQAILNGMLAKATAPLAPALAHAKRAAETAKGGICTRMESNWHRLTGC